MLGTTVPLWNRNRKAIAEAEGKRDEERLTALQTWRGLVQEAAAAAGMSAAAIWTRRTLTPVCFLIPKKNAFPETLFML